MVEPLLTAAGIILPSLLLTWAIRRWFDPVPWRAAAGFLGLIFLFLGAAVLTPDLPVPADEAARGYPYAGVVGEVHARNALTNDTTRLFLPWMQAVREELFQGRLPLWNRYSFSGYPLLGNGESAPFFPVFLATLFVPLPKQIVAMAGVKIFIALIFSFVLLRREKASDAAAACGAIVFAFASFQVVYLYYSTTAVTSLLPAATYALANASDRPRRASSLWLLAFVVAALQTAGHPESVFHVAVGAGIFLLIDVVASDRVGQDSSRRGALGAAAVSIALGTLGGMLISAPAWMPVLQQVFLSTRFEEIAGQARVMTPPFPGATAYALLNPDLFGNPAYGSWNWILNYSLVASSYFGLLPLALLPAAVLSMRASRRDRLLALASIATFLVAMNWTPLGNGVNAIVPFSLVANDKLRFVTAFFVAICAARTIERMTVRIPPLAAIGSAIVLALALHAFLQKLGATVGWRSAWGLAAVAIFWIGVVASHRLKQPSLVGGAAILAAAVDLILLNFGFNAITDRRYYRPVLPIVEAIHSIRLDEPFRVVGHDWVLMPNASALYRLEDIRGSDPMSLARYTRFLAHFTVSEPGMDVQRVNDLDRPEIDFLNVRYVLAPPDSRGSSTWLEVYRGADGVLLQNAEWLPRFFVPSRVLADDERGIRNVRLEDPAHTVFATGLDSPLGQAPGTMRLRQSSPTRFQMALETKARTFIASSQPFSPGWSVSIDGNAVPVHLVNSAFIGFFTPAGRHEIRVDYRPPAFFGSLILTIVGLMLVAFAARRLESMRAPS